MAAIRFTNTPRKFSPSEEALQVLALRLPPGTSPATLGQPQPELPSADEAVLQSLLKAYGHGSQDLGPGRDMGGIVRSLVNGL